MLATLLGLVLLAESVVGIFVTVRRVRRWLTSRNVPPAVTYPSMIRNSAGDVTNTVD